MADFQGITRHGEGAVITLTDERLIEVMSTKNRGFRMVLYFYSEAHEKGSDKKAVSMRKVREEFELVSKR